MLYVCLLGSRGYSVCEKILLPNIHFFENFRTPSLTAVTPTNVQSNLANGRISILSAVTPGGGEHIHLVWTLIWYMVP